MSKFRTSFLLVPLLVMGLILASIAPVFAAVTVTGTERADLIKAFEDLDKSGNNGNWFRTSTNESGALAWNQGPVMYSYLRMYEATGDKVYLDRFIVHADSVLKTRDSVRGVTDYRGLSLPAWRAGSSYTLGSKFYIFAAHTGMIVSPMADFARIVKEENLQEYQAKAALYLQAAKDAVAVHDDEWVDEGGQGYYRSRKGAPIWSDGVGLPFNMYTIMGEAQINLYLATGESIYRERAEKMARHFKNHLTLNQTTGAYVWNYWWGIAFTGWTSANNPTTNTPEYKGYRVIEDINHGVLEMRFVEKAYRADIVFTDTDMDRFGNTVSKNMIKTNTSVSLYVNGNGAADSPLRLGGWSMLYPWAPQILNVNRNVRFNAAIGMSGLSLYTKALSEINGWNNRTPNPPDNGGTPPGNDEPTPPGSEEPAPPVVNPPATGELIINGGFDSGCTGWDVGNSGVIGTEANGNKFVSNSYNWSLGQDLTLIPGKRYLVNAQTRKGNATTQARIVVAGIDVQNKLINQNNLDIRYTHKGTGWESIPAAEFTVPAGAVKVRIYLLTNGGTGTHEFDNISIKEKQEALAPPANPPAPPVNEEPAPPAVSPPAIGELIKNGGFDGGRTGWDVGNSGVIGNEANGNKYISNGYNWSLGQDLTLIPGKRYVVNAQTRKGNATTQARIVVAGIDAQNKLINQNSLDIWYTHKGTGWESIPAAEFTVPAGAVKVRIYLLTNGGTGTHHFDNISIKERASSPPVNNPPATPVPAELVKNGGFDNGRTGWDVGNSGVISTETNGNKYVSNGYNWSFGQDLTLTPGKRYVVNAQTRKGNATTEARIVVAGIDSQGKLITQGALDIRHKHRGAGWESIPATQFTVPAGAEKVRVYLLINGGTGSHYFDNISIKAI